MNGFKKKNFKKNLIQTAHVSLSWISSVGLAGWMLHIGHFETKATRKHTHVSIVSVLQSTLCESIEWQSQFIDNHAPIGATKESMEMSANR